MVEKRKLSLTILSLALTVQLFIPVNERLGQHNERCWLQSEINLICVYLTLISIPCRESAAIAAELYLLHFTSFLLGCTKPLEDGGVHVNEKFMA